MRVCIVFDVVLELYGVRTRSPGRLFSRCSSWYMLCGFCQLFAGLASNSHTFSILLAYGSSLLLAHASITLFMSRQRPPWRPPSDHRELQHEEYLAWWLGAALCAGGCWFSSMPGSGARTCTVVETVLPKCMVASSLRTSCVPIFFVLALALEVQVFVQELLGACCVHAHSGSCLAGLVGCASSL